MKLAFSTNAYLNFSFQDAVARLAAIGYRGVEVMADVPHAWPAYLLPEQKQAIRDALAANRLAVSNVNAFMMHAVNDPRQKYWHPSWIEPDPHYRRIRIVHTKRALTLAKEIGAPCITTEPGGPLEGRPGPDGSQAEGPHPARPLGGHRRDAGPPPPDPRRGGDRLREYAQGADGCRLRRVGDGRAIHLPREPGLRGADGPGAGVEDCE